MSPIEIERYETRDADDRGRINVGADLGGETIDYVVLESGSLEIRDGPQTATVATDGRLSLGPEYADEKDVRVGILEIRGESDT